MTQDKMTVQNINTPGRTETVRADKYTDMRAALLKVMPTEAPGLPFKQIKERAIPHLSAELFPDGKTSGWWAKTVQLDLEAKGQILRTQARPLTFYKS